MYVCCDGVQAEILLETLLAQGRLNKTDLLAQAVQTACTVRGVLATDDTTAKFQEAFFQLVRANMVVRVDGSGAAALHRTGEPGAATTAAAAAADAEDTKGVKVRFVFVFISLHVSDAACAEAEGTAEEARQAGGG